MKITNPVEDKLEVKIEGEDYSIEGGETIDIPEPHARYWKNRLHDFLVLEESDSATEKIVDEDPEVEEVIKEVKEEAEEQDVEVEVEEIDEEDIEDYEEGLEKIKKLAAAKGVEVDEDDSIEDIKDKLKE